MKRWLVLGAAVSFTACSPDIPVGPDQSSKYSTAEFDPATGVVPSPNDLAFLDANGNLDTHLHVPSPPGTSDAQKEFNDNYLNLLDGFPMESSASVLFTRPIDLSVVNAGTVRVIDITNQLQPIPITTASYSVSDSTNGQQFLNITPQGGTWTRGHHYAIAVIGGGSGIKGKNGETVIGSSTWALVSSDQSLVSCDAGVCRAATSAIPTTEKDPAAQVAQQLAIAQQLEALRLLYAPLLNALSGSGVPRGDIAVLWTFQITSAAEVTFDPANSVIPFPNDALNPTGSKVTLPVPPDAGILTELYQGLNTLDGFSTTAPIVSENGDGTGPLLGGRLPGTPYTLGAASPINMVPTGPGTGATAYAPLPTTACVNCTVNMTLPDGGPILLPDGGLKPDTLEIVPQVPLAERTQYAVYITTDLKDSTGKNVIPTATFALTRSSAPLFSGGKSTVSLLTDAQAEQLEALRAGLKPLFDTLNSNGLPRTKVALAWAFTTQSNIRQLQALNAIPTSAAAAAIPGVPLWVQEIPAPGVPTTGVGHWFIGEIVDVFLLTDPRGVFDPANPKTPAIPFVMSVPASAQPGSGYPVVIYGHGLGRTRTDGFALSSSLAQAGQVMIAIDEPWHGDRNTCNGFGAFAQAAGIPGATDDFACANPTTQACNADTGRCQSRDRSGALGCAFGSAVADKVCILAGPTINGQGHCAPDNHCENATFSVASNGWNLLNLQNFFATRDNFRQAVVSDSQLARVIASTDNGNLGAQAGPITLNGDKISYAGQSLGGILGTLYCAASSAVKNAALNVPGGDPVRILLESPAFAPQKNAFIAGLAAQGIPKDSPTYDTFLGIAKWIIDPADPVNAGGYLVRSTGLTPDNGGGTRRAFIQWIANDQVVPNSTTTELIRSVLGDPGASGVLVSPTTEVPNFWAKQFPSDANPANNHGFLLGSAGAAVAGEAQTEIGKFVNGLAPF
jgi:hypothetical protein